MPVYDVHISIPIMCIIEISSYNVLQLPHLVIFDYQISSKTILIFCQYTISNMDIHRCHSECRIPCKSYIDVDIPLKRQNVLFLASPCISYTAG